MTVILSVDVEDWAQSTLDTDLPVTARAERNMNHLLDLMAAEGRQMTCFVLGKYAERFPASVRRIVDDGHELASHGYGHINVFTQSPDAFREDVVRSKKMLEDMTGVAVRGYRAPNFSLGPAGDWPLEILAGLGFEYDSSIFPSATYKYGRAGWPTHPVKIELADGRALTEFPAATIRTMGRDWPVAGGGYFRLMPWCVIRPIVRHLLDRDGVFTTYCHPYEFDPDEFREMNNPPGLGKRLHQGLGRRGFETKFLRLIKAFTTMTSGQVLKHHDFPRLRLQDGILHRETVPERCAKKARL